MMALSKAKFVVAVVALVLLTGGIGAILYGQVAQTGSNANTVADGKQVTGKQVIVETHMLRLDTDKIPANIRQFLSQPATKPGGSSYLTSEQRDQLLKAVSDADGEVLASPTLLLLDGTEAEVKAVSLRRYLDSVEPNKERGAQGQIMYLPHVQDAESGTTLKVKVDVSKDGKYVSLYLHPHLVKLLELCPYTFETETQGRKDHLSIQQPRTQDAGVETHVTVPDGQTLVLGGQAISQKPKSQTLLILVRPTILATSVQPTTRRTTPAAIAIQTRLLSISRNFADDIGLPHSIAGNPLFLDDAQVQKLLRAVEATKSTSAVTIPRITIANGQEALSQATNATSYVSTFKIAKDAAGKLTYEPKIESIDAGVTFHVTASAVPGQDAVNISANLVISHIAGIASFTFLDKPSKLTVQQPEQRVLSANLTAVIPDRHWLIVRSWQIDSTVVRETSSGLPIVGRLLGMTNRTVARDTVVTYLLIRPEMLDQMPSATAPGLGSH